MTRIWRIDRSITITLAVVLLSLSTLNMIVTSTAANNKIVSSECVQICPSSPICTLPNNDPSAGIYYSRTPDIKSTIAGVFTVDAENGNIYYCDVKSDIFLTAEPPSGYSGQYSGLGGWDTWYSANVTSYSPAAGILTLVETSSELQGMLFCHETQIKHCTGGLQWVTFPTSYCDQFQSERCDPEGTVLDANLNVYWVDPINQVLTECFAPQYTSCSTLISQREFQFQSYGRVAVEPTGLAFFNGTEPYLSPGWQFYITDGSCTGNVWRVTENYGYGWRLSLVATMNDSLSGIGSSTRGTPNNYQQVFVEDTGSCTNTPAKLVDISPNPISISLPTSVGQTMYLSTCVGQCLGYYEGVSDRPPPGIYGENMFASLGAQDYATDTNNTA